MTESERTGSKLAETPWRRLHPASLAVNLLPQAWRTARGAWPLLLALFVGGDNMGLRAFDLSILMLFTGLTLVRTVLHYFTLRYRLHDGRLELRSGLLHRQARTIDPKRIQNIELVRNPFHRLSGLVELRIETAGDASTEGLLSALGVAEAERLRDALRKSERPAPSPDAPPDRPDTELLRLGTIEIIAFGLTRRTMGTAALLSAVFYQLMNASDPEQAQDVAARLGGATLAGAVLLAFAGSFILSVGQALLRHHRFRLLKIDDRLATEEGLLTRRRVEIPVSKVQIVQTDETLLRRSMGYGTVQIETAGMGMSEGKVSQAEAQLPMVERAELALLSATAIPHLDIDPWTAKLLPPHPRALLRAAFRRFVTGCILGAGLTALYFPWGVAALVLLPLFGVLVAWLDWRWQGWRITPRAVVSRRGFFTRKTWIVARDKVQSVHIGQSPFMRWQGLASVVVRVAGSDVLLPEIGLDEALQVLGTLQQTDPATPSPTEQPVHRQDAADDAHEVREEARGDRVA